MSSKSLSKAALLAAPLTLVSLASGQTAYSEATDIIGAGFAHFDGAFAYAMGGGAAWFDMDLDGDEDLFTLGSSARHGMFENNGGVFTDIVQFTGLAPTSQGSTIGVAGADYNNDGLADLMLCNTGPNQLYRNNGDKTFTDVAQATGIVGSAWSSCASWADFDLDGDLDIYFGNYVQVLNFPYHFGDANTLFINTATASAPMFVDQAAALGVDNSGVFGPSIPGFPYIAPTGQATAGCTLSICTLDEDEDGDPDLLVGNDFGEWVLPNAFYRNDLDLGAGLAFTDISASTGFDADGHYNMGINPADYDHDGDWDFYMSNLGENKLFRNDAGVYSGVAAAAGVLDGVHPVTGDLISSWGTSFGDMNNDGWEDLVVVNGWIPAALFITNEKRAVNHLFLNNQDGTFSQVSEAASGMDDEMVGRGIAVTDLDKDGFLDHYVMNNGATSVALPGDRCRYYKNEGTLATLGAANWLELHLVGRFGNISALGARIDLTAGGTTWKRQVLGDPVFASSSSRTAHFGMGAEKIAELVTIDWSRGTHQELVGIPAGNFFEVLEPAVVVDSIDAPVWVGGAGGGTFVLRAHLRNQDTVPQTTDIAFNLHLGHDGPLVLSIPMQVTLQPGELRDVDLVLPATAAEHTVLQGLTIDERVYVGAAGGFDSRQVVVPIP
jgi:enediyne biosynthesis protein E4